MRLFDYTGDPQHDRFERVAHLGTFNANPLSAAAGLATLRLAADGTPQAHANRMAELLRRGMEAVLDELQVAGYVYGDASVFHVYLEAFPGRGAATRQALRTTDAATLKGIPGPLVDAFQRNLAIHGVDLLSYTGGVTSAAHTESDIQHTIEAFRRTMRTLVEHNLVARVG
jgi:glutamate-1-semialdehyde 2,1-aminomutase